MLVLLILALLLPALAPSVAVAKETPVPYSLEDRDRMVRIEARLDGIEKGIDDRFKQLDKRFDEMGKRIRDLQDLLLWLTLIFVVLTIVSIGFAVVNRRMMIDRFERRLKMMEDSKVDKIRAVLLAMSALDEKFAQAIEKAGGL